MFMIYRDSVYDANRSGRFEYTSSFAPVMTGLCNSGQGRFVTSVISHADGSPSLCAALLSGA